MSSTIREVRDELAAARSLLAAIAELMLVPRIDMDQLGDGGYAHAYQRFTSAQRERAVCVKIAAESSNSWTAGERSLRKWAAEDLGYIPCQANKEEKSEDHGSGPDAGSPASAVDAGPGPG